VEGKGMVASCFGLQLVKHGRWREEEYPLGGGPQRICWTLSLEVLSPSGLVMGPWAWVAGHLGGEGLVGEGLWRFHVEVVVGVLRKVGAWGEDCGDWDR